MDIRRGTIGENYFLIFNTTVYLFLVPMLFYLPLHFPHRAMVAYREKLMSDTAKHYHEEHRKILQGLSTDAEELETKLKYLDGLQKLQEHNRKYPVWPFNFRTSLGVFANAITPTVPTVIGLALNRLG